MLLHVSDPHFGTEQPLVVQALLRLAHELRPELVVLSGDITQRARAHQFRAAREFVDRLGVANTVAIPGNHDIPLFNVAARIAAPYGSHVRAFGRTLEPEYCSDRWLVIAVNTTRAYRHVDGEVSAEQVERVARRLASASDAQLRAVVVHQPIGVMREADRKDLLHGHRHATERWSQAGADLVLGGHIHLPYVLPLHEQIRGLPRRIWAVQAGTAVSRRVREGVPNSVNVIRHHDETGDGRCVVEQWDYTGPGNRFERVRSTSLHVGAHLGPHAR